MHLNGMLYGSKLLGHVGFPASEVLGPDAGEDAIQDLITCHGLVFVEPVFRGGVGKKGSVTEPAIAFAAPIRSWSKVSCAACRP